MSMPFGKSSRNGLWKKCPKCGSENKEVGITTQKVVTFIDGSRSTSNYETDAGYTECLKCGNKEYN